MRSTAHLDWLSVTYPVPTSPHDTLPNDVSQSPFKRKGTGSNGYRDMLTNEHGVTVLLNGSESQGVHCVLSGQALENLRIDGQTDRSLCQHIVARGGRASRLDAAINLHGGQMTVGDVAEAYSQGLIKTPARSGLRREGINIANSAFDLGNRSSERFLRVYDKNAEQKIVDQDAWLRLELECKKLRARALVNVIATEENTRAVINSAIQEFIDMPGDNELNEALADQGVEIPTRPRKMTDRRRWLLEQVAPAFASEIAENPGDEVEQAFWTAVHVRLAEIHSFRNRPGVTESNPDE